MSESEELPRSPKDARIEEGTSSRAQSSSSVRKYTGAATYKSMFQSSWQRKLRCVKAVKNDLHSFHCTVCSKKLSCKDQGERDVTRHLQSAGHQFETLILM